MIKIALDAMGGDFAPQVVVEGAVKAVSGSIDDIKVILTGPEDVIREEVKKLGYKGDKIEIFHAPQIVAMDDSPSDVLKTKQNSGLVACVALQKQGLADASISAGNSGAMMAACLMILGRAGKMSRPAIACDMPSLKRPVVLLDCGANVDEKPVNLLHFAICGSVYAEYALEYDSPKVGLLNVGEEEKKGGEVIQEAHQILKSAPLNFIGNVEGRDIVRGTADVVVTPGYTGNVVLKLCEGFYELHNEFFGLIDSDAGRKFDKEWNYSNNGAALLLGLNGTGLITHGRADALTIEQGVLRGYQLSKKKIPQKIAAKLEELQ